MPEEFVIQVLEKQNRKNFSCGVEVLDKYFHNYVTQDVRAGVSKCYIAINVQNNQIVSFYTLSASSVNLDRLPPEISKKLPRYAQVSAALVGRLAVDLNYKGQGLGGLLLVDAVQRTKNSGLGVFLLMGVFLLIVDAKDDGAKQFYEKFGFLSFTDNPLQLFLPIPSARSRELF
jgi:ribosomal protein S18 acetylase RimI-like enzyme